jgi:protein-S-isoprenylcysteine O-methyltransferase Ste14
MRKVLLAFIVVLMATAAFVVIDQTSAQHSRIVGAVCVAIGVPLLVLSRVHLGRAFAIAPKATTLVTHGVYAKVPHPLYAFLDVALLGLVIALRTRWLVLGWLALVMVHGWAARREARVLEAAFGDAYRKYRAQTWW